MKKILVPVVFNDTSRQMVHQAAYLARHFHSHVILLHVVTLLDYPAGTLESAHEIKVHDLHTEIARGAQGELEEAFQSELKGLPVKRMVLMGHPAREIAQAANDENVDLIVMSTHGYGPFYRFLLGSVTAKVLHETERQVWIGAHQEKAPTGEFAIRTILCAVDFNRHARDILSRAAELAREFSARLVLTHVTTSVENYGPGGSYVLPEFKKAVVEDATKKIGQLQQDVGTKADVVIDGGEVHRVLSHLAERTKADLLVIGHTPLRGHIGENGNGYSIIRDAHVPVLSI